MIKAKAYTALFFMLLLSAFFLPKITKAAEEQKDITISFCGDILFDNGVKTKISKGGTSSIASEKLIEQLKKADYRVANLEFPFSKRGTPMPKKQYTFRGDPSHIQSLHDLGIQLVSLANNHTLDYGHDALLDTLDLLNKNKIKYVGAGKNLEEASKHQTVEINGKKIAFLGASRVVPVVEWYATAKRPGCFTTYDPKALNKQIALAKAENDYVIVYVHWGVERNTKPEKYQKDMAHGYIDNGADVVIGSHPHVLQGFEYYKGKPIAYSLGNFIFTDAKKDTGILDITLSEKSGISMSFVPCRITNQKTDVITDEKSLSDIKKLLQDISFGITIDKNWQILPK